MISTHSKALLTLLDSWVVLRSQEREVLAVAKKLPENPAKGKWCEEEDDWGTPPRLVLLLNMLF